MAINKTTIEWSQYTWKITEGCNHGCSFCYVKRFRKDMTPKFYPDRINEPYRLKKSSLIFVANTGDLFGDWQTGTDIRRVLDVIDKCNKHIFQVLTKNPARLTDFNFPDNCWVGTSIESQDKLIRLDYLKKCIANVKFVSFEPLKGSIECDLTGLDWVIIGPESVGNASIPLEPENARKWAKPLVEAVRKASIPLFIKPCGGWWPEEIREMPTAFTCWQETNK